MATRVELTKTALKQARKAPKHIVDKLQAWVLDVERDGLEAVRFNPGLHDEPLKGKREGQRSIRLSRKWRAIYTEHQGEVILVLVQEVSAHDY